MTAAHLRFLPNLCCAAISHLVLGGKGLRNQGNDHSLPSGSLRLRNSSACRPRPALQRRLPPLRWNQRTADSPRICPAGSHNTSIGCIRRLPRTLRLPSSGFACRRIYSYDALQRLSPGEALLRFQSRLRRLPLRGMPTKSEHVFLETADAPALALNRK